ncbi:MAG: YIP1 family protein [Lachnospiraceae bacterium]|nr:YIP1 family protein [Lachnospiraceae bacterium]
MSTWERVKYVKHCLFHPFDGFYEAKNRGKGSILAATVLIALYCILDCVEVQYTGFIMNLNQISRMNSVTIFISALTVLLLAVISNWTITTLFDGKGKLKDIYMVLGYSLAPMVVIDACIVLASNFVIEEEAVILVAIRWMGIAWSAFLIVTGLCTVHEFSLAKTLVTILATLAAALIILFLLVLFISLVEQMVQFIYIFSKEFMRRI